LGVLVFWQYNEDKCHVQQVNDVNIIKFSQVKKKGFLRNERDTPRKSNGRDAPRESNTGRNAPGESKVRGAQRPTKIISPMLVSFQYLF
jgi:hypothetical protein